MFRSMPPLARITSPLSVVLAAKATNTITEATSSGVGTWRIGETLVVCSADLEHGAEHRLGLRQTRHYHVGEDALGREFSREGSGQAMQGRFRRPIGRAAWISVRSYCRRISTVPTPSFRGVGQPGARCGGDDMEHATQQDRAIARRERPRTEPGQPPVRCPEWTALLTRMSILPQRAATASTASRIDWSELISSATAIASPPRSPIPAATVSARSR